MIRSIGVGVQQVSVVLGLCRASVLQVCYYSVLNVSLCACCFTAIQWDTAPQALRNQS